MASEEQVIFNEPHAPHANAIKAFNIVLPTIKEEVIKSRHDWNKHEPKMWSRAHGLSDAQLTAFTAEKNLVLIRSGPTSYGTILLGKFEIPNFKDDLGKGFIHVRVHDPPGDGDRDVRYHSIWTDEGRETPESPPTLWRAIQTEETPLKFFNE